MNNTKNIAFVSPIGNGGPSELYKTLVPLLSHEMWGHSINLVMSTKEWIKLHFYGGKYDTIVSVLPFLWKPNCQNFILNIHGDYREDRGWKNPGAVLAFFYPWSARFADMFIFPSEYLRKKLNLQHKHERIIGNICAFPIRETPKEKVWNPIKLISTTNWNHPQKAEAMLTLIKTIIEQKEVENIEWTIIGWWDLLYKEYIESITKKNISIKVQTVGLQENKQVQKLLEESDVFIYATYVETFGIAILEAASQWLPLILLSHDAFSWLWNDEAIFHLDDMAHEIKKLKEDELYYRNRSEASLTDARKFRKEWISKKWKDLFDNI